MAFLDFLINKFSANEIQITLNRDVVIFQSGDSSLRLEPVLYLAADSRNPRVLLIGNSIDLTEPFERIDLFDGKQILVKGLDKTNALEMFFHFGFTQLAGRLALVRPRVVFVSGSPMSEIFGGYERVVLMQTAANAGAREVVFE
ncbi:MAG TPA: hypothetical protein DD706_23270 [Nitrospiraceae bacterium]|nr:hypothetical protein [Nitrospiraceae bacterium]